MRQGNVGHGITRIGKAVALTTAALLGLAFWASGARAQYEFLEYGHRLSSGGNFDRQAGGHPDFITRLELSEVGFRSVIVNLPPGLVANPTAAATCPPDHIGSGENSLADCPIASQVGYVQTLEGGGHPGIDAPVYNMTHPSNLPALLAFNVAGVITKIQPTVRSSDYGVTADTHSISQGLQIDGVELRLWGVPADPVHDSERFNPATFGFGISSDVEPRPFMIAPASCGSPPSKFTVSSDSWWNPGVFVNAEVDVDPSGTPFLFEGCGRLHFEPTDRVEPDSRAAGAPIGLNFSLTVPQNEAPYGLSTPDLKRAVVKFPPGVAVSPSSADGLGACTLEEIGLGTNTEPTCPASSRIGSVEVKTPLLGEPLAGDVIVARQNENPFHSLLALYLVIRGPGIMIKLPGRVDLDNATGQLTVEFDNTPQLPFEKLSVEIEGGPKAALAAPSACGTYTTQAEFTTWAASTPVEVSTPMTIDQGCAPGGFSPALRAGSANATGGSFSAFALQVTRQADEQNLSRIEATLPPGLLAKLAGVPLCGDAEAASGNCPPRSQVGTTTVGAGPGPNPIYVPEPGKAPTAVYLAGSYKGAPYSLVVKVPAQAGPFDLGTVVVRNALRIDPATTQVTAESDPLPQILEGIPISYRDVRVEINKPEFTVNPTNCSQFAVTSALTSAVGQTASPKAPFVAANCERLGFKPSLALQMKGQTRRAGNPALTATLKAPAGQANIAKTAVILPKTVFIDQRHVSNPCTRIQFAANACPAKSILGTATAWSPLLDRPLEGPVYFRSNGGERQLPDLVADLDGQIHVTLVGFIDSKKVSKETSLLRTRFASLPDAPVSKFVLKLLGGKRSLIQNSDNLCKVRPKAEVLMEGQNGKIHGFKQNIAVACGKAKKAKKKG
jgi:hypothetical protein